MLHADLNNWDSADDTFRQCLELCEERGDRRMIANVLVNRSEVSCARERYDDAVAACDLAISITEELGAEVQRGEALRWKGYALARAGRLQAAEEASREAMRIGRRTHVKLLEAESTRDLGFGAVTRGDIPRARKWLERALELFETLGVSRDATEVREQLGKLPA
jgi:tetratricopeptide (TPR) repeat protein